MHRLNPIRSCRSAASRTAATVASFQASAFTNSSTSRPSLSRPTAKAHPYRCPIPNDRTRISVSLGLALRVRIFGGTEQKAERSAAEVEIRPEFILEVAQPRLRKRLQLIPEQCKGRWSRLGL